MKYIKEKKSNKTNMTSYNPQGYLTMFLLDSVSVHYISRDHIMCGILPDM